MNSITQRAALVILLASFANFPAIGAQTSKTPAADVFRARCFGCHSFACNRSGPKLEGVLGRKAASLSDFGGYTEALKESGLTWTEETLNRFLEDPGKLVPGTLMTAARKVENAKERQMLIQFIKRPDTSMDLCSGGR